MDPAERIEAKLDRIITLLQHLLALQLANGGVNKAEIGKHLKIAKSTIVKMLRDFNKED